MRFLTLILAAAALVAGCGKGPEPSAATPAPAANSSAGSNTPSTPANVGQPSAQEKKDGANPVQGQVDPKEGPQHKDFEQRGDSAGPKQSK